MSKTRIRVWISGREYEVTFDDANAAINVENIGLYRNRTTWSCYSDKAPSLTASCAIRAAQKQLNCIGGID